ncbi:hypothetical protein [Acinetobacter indicus]|uniref:hypothetical protein n=1 Tax=Acinetobacter indicus TaxID=756892 RepID=UPI002575F323|nr:hypothetical protein [Acinetobacter indicus]MDM1274027.1 hypothetical protein [Acinetobacter indicus]
MSKRLVKKAAMHSIISQEDALKKVKVFQEKTREAGVIVSKECITEFLAEIEHHLKESLDWTAGIYEIGD